MLETIWGDYSSVTSACPTVKVSVSTLLTPEPGRARFDFPSALFVLNSADTATVLPGTRLAALDAWTFFEIHGGPYFLNRESE